MVANCVNPSCNRQFHELSKGRLFVLPPFDDHGARLSDYCYWLCPGCADKYTIMQYEVADKSPIARHFIDTRARLNENVNRADNLLIKRQRSPTMP